MIYHIPQFDHLSNLFQLNAHDYNLDALKDSVNLANDQDKLLQFLQPSRQHKYLYFSLSNIDNFFNDWTNHCSRVIISTQFTYCFI